MTAASAFDAVQSYLCANGWYQDGDDAGLWLPDQVTVGVAFAAQLDRDGFPCGDAAMTVEEALLALAAPEPEPFRQVMWGPDDFRRWDEWNDRRIEALRFAETLRAAV